MVWNCSLKYEYTDTIVNSKLKVWIRSYKRELEVWNPRVEFVSSQYGFAAANAKLELWNQI